MKMNTIANAIKTNDTKLLAIGTCVGIVATGVISWRAAWKLRPKWEQKMYELSICIDDEAKKQVKKELFKEVAKATWPIPFIVGGTIAGSIGQYCVPAKRIASLTTSYGLLDTAFRELKEQQVKTLGETKAKQIVEDALDEHVKSEESKKEIEEFKKEVKRPEGYIIAKDGYGSPKNIVWTTHNNLEKAILTASSRVQQENYITLNEFYDLLNFERAPMGEELGFDTRDLDRGILNIDIHTTGLTEEGEPCIVIGYHPRYLRPFC